MRLSVKPSPIIILLAAALIVCAGCVPAAPAPVAATQPAMPATLAPPVTAAATAQPAGEAGRPEIPVGVDADGNFYRGDPKAPVKLVDFSDFQ